MDKTETFEEAKAREARMNKILKSRAEEQMIKYQGQLSSLSSHYMATLTEIQALLKKPLNQKDLNDRVNTLLKNGVDAINDLIQEGYKAQSCKELTSEMLAGAIILRDKGLPMEAYIEAALLPESEWQETVKQAKAMRSDLARLECERPTLDAAIEGVKRFFGGEEAINQKPNKPRKSKP